MNRKEFGEKLKRKMSPSLVRLVFRAYRRAKYGHKGQERDSGERYFEHLRAVALILIDECEIYDHEMIIAALLHDIIEDTYSTDLEEIKSDFGERVARIVRILSKVEEVDGGNSFEIKKEEACCYFDDLEAADEDTRIVKLADRLHNLRTLSGCEPEKRKRKLDETIRVFLPLAARTSEVLYKKLDNEIRIWEDEGEYDRGEAGK